MMRKTFKGANVFMSRNLVPPEMFDSLQDALNLNGAQLFLCCDPSRNGPNDYHIISSPHHEKFNHLREKSCNLLGPQCVLSCAKEQRILPKQGFICCLAMDGVKVLASGFEMDEKVEIGKLVTAMGGVLHTKVSLDVNFVIVKNVLAAKYKWALNILKKPIVTLDWLHQCWKEHRVVPQESYRVLPFSGLTICVTKIPADERKEVEKLVIQNGGKYSAELTKKCTHLVCDAPEGDKYKVAKKWGHIYIVTRKWFDLSIARKACLSEDSYPVLGSSASSINTGSTYLTAKHCQDKVVGNLECAPSSATDANLQTVLSDGTMDPDLEVILSQNMSSAFSDAPIFIKEEEGGAPATKPINDINLDGCVADDSQTEDNDLYLSDCRILLLGFDASEMRKLVNMVRIGGGSRYMSFNEKLTHIVVGTPSEIEKKEVRGLAALGVIYVVRTIWLEDCDREKKEISVLQRHIAHDFLLPRDPIFSNKGAMMCVNSMSQGKSSTVQSTLPDQLWRNMNSGFVMSSEKWKERERDCSLRSTVGYTNQSQFCSLNGNDKGQQKIQRGSSNEIQDRKSSVFKGRLFCFCSSFPEERRDEIVQWVNQGGGEVVDDQTEKKVHFTIDCHGSLPARPMLKGVGHLLDVGSHILYSPLPCRVPLPGFERYCICVSQYDEKDRLLLRNLCFVLGAKFVEKFTKKVTHLLCKFTCGPKYEAASRLGIQSVTSEWIFECVKQNVIVAPFLFCPKEVSPQDQEAGFCTMSQFPSQVVRMTSGDDASQFPSQFQDLKIIQNEVIGSRSDSVREDAKYSNICNKRTRLLENDSLKGLLSSGLSQNDPICKMKSTENNSTEKVGKDFYTVPDVAAAIEDLLEQTSKIHDPKSPGRTGRDNILFSADCSTLGQDHADPLSAFGLPKHWIKRTDKKDEICNPSGDVNVDIYDGFSETQTESQVVGYEEDLSGRQMIIDRVRTRSSMT